MNKCRVALLSAMLASTGAFAADGDLELNIGGFVWGDVGFGDRYDGSDDDQAGVSKAAITVSPEYGNTRAVVVLGADNIFNDDHFNDGSGSGDTEFKEVFVGIKFDLAGGTFDTTLGKQPLLFGLKPNGWVGDRSIQSGLEFGGGTTTWDGMNTSGQVVTGLLFDWSWGGGGSGSAASSVGSDGTVSVRFGFFDTSEDGPGDDASTLGENYILQIRADDLFGTGVYGVAGYEGVYQGATDDTETLYTLGLGWEFNMFDLSLEYQSIAEEIMGTADDETLIIAEATFNLNEQWAFYVDYATADESEVDTLRVGAIYSYNDHLDFVIEYSDDTDDIDPNAEVDSIDLRAAFSF